MFEIPVLCDKERVFEKTNSTSCSALFSNCDHSDFDTVCAFFEGDGFVKKEKNINRARAFAAFEKDGYGVFINYFLNTRELGVVYERDCRYFDYSDTVGAPVTLPQITQVHLEDFGMSYVIRLSDGRFIVIDGGREFEPDAHRLFEALGDGAVIAAWIMTHPHCDHFHCFFTFMGFYGDKVTVEKFLFNFPDDVGQYPELTTTNGTYDAASVSAPRFVAMVKDLGVPVYMPHTGQHYAIGDACFDVLACVDDAVFFTKGINSTSLVLSMTLAGQRVLWAADSSFSYVRLAQRYADTLRSDILQVPHHGFGGGTPKGLMDAYDCIKAPVYLFPVANFNAYENFCVLKEPTRYLMTRDYVKEMITGDVTRTLTLPYTCDSNGVAEHCERMRVGATRSGSCTWVFTDLDTAVRSDFSFSALNMTHVPADVTVDIYFEDRKNNVMNKTLTLGAMSVSHIDLAEFFTPVSGGGAPFAVRFKTAYVPVVISHKTHKPAYN